MAEDQLFYVGQKALIRKGNDVLILKTNANTLDFPGGKIKIGEINLAEALKREVFEETGLEVNVGKPFRTWTMTVVDPSSRINGQCVYFVAYLCEYISGDLSLSGEHQAYKWVNKNNYKDILSNRDEVGHQRALEEYFEKK